MKFRQDGEDKDKSKDKFKDELERKLRHSEAQTMKWKTKYQETEKSFKDKEILERKLTESQQEIERLTTFNLYSKKKAKEGKY